MNYYRITGCYSMDGTDWKTIKKFYSTVENTIQEAKRIYQKEAWNNIAVELDDESNPGSYEAVIVWDAGHDKISNFNWD